MNRVRSPIPVNQDSIYPIMGECYSEEDFVSIDLSTDAFQNRGSLTEKKLLGYISEQVRKSCGKLAYGGYGERRNLYSSSPLFSDPSRERNIHLAIDIWAPPLHPIYAPIEGTVHSFAYNDKALDYGYTLILFHQIEEVGFYTLYGHLGKKYYETREVGHIYPMGSEIGVIGQKNENGGWLPHLHFQIIMDIEGFFGDYPGVADEREADQYLLNCPDPSFLFKKAL